MPPKPISDAYTLVSRLTLNGLGAVASGIAPPPSEGWPEGQQVLALHIKAAREIAACGDRPNIKEINDRLEGPVVQETKVTGGITVVSSLGPPAAAQPQLPPKEVN
jgi:hypothetical protein